MNSKGQSIPGLYEKYSYAASLTEKNPEVPGEEAATKNKPDLNPEEISFKLMQVRALVRRLHLVSLSNGVTLSPEESEVKLKPLPGGFDLNALLDEGIVEETVLKKKSRSGQSPRTRAHRKRAQKATLPASSFRTLPTTLCNVGKRQPDCQKTHHSLPQKSLHYA